LPKIEIPKIETSWFKKPKNMAKVFVAVLILDLGLVIFIL